VRRRLDRHGERERRWDPLARPGALLLFSFDEDKGNDPDSEGEVLGDGTYRYVGGRREGMLFRPYTNAEILGLFERAWTLVEFEGADTAVPRRGLFERVETDES